MLKLAIRVETRLNQITILLKLSAVVELNTIKFPIYDMLMRTLSFNKQILII